MQAVAPPTPKFDVLHLDECFVAVSKPPGLLVHRTREASDQVFLLQELGAQLGRFLYPAHRLDRATSGVITFAFSGEDARLLQMSLNGGETRKEYLALVRGSTPEEWEDDRPLSNKAGVKQAARTSFRRLAEFSRSSLLRARLFTGRRHQIRRHLAHKAHQVIGDTSHGKGRINQFFRDNYGLPRLFLHAERLEMPHPRTGDPLAIHVPLATDLREFLERLPDCPRELIATL